MAFNLISIAKAAGQDIQNQTILFFLNSNKVSEVNIAKAGAVIQKVERDLLAQCPKRLNATFLIGKADYFIRRATRRGLGISEGERNLDFQRGNLCLNFCHKKVNCWKVLTTILLG